MKHALALLLALHGAIHLLGFVKGFGLAAAPALLLSQALIAGAWAYARFGTVANVLVAASLAAAVVRGAPGSLRSELDRESPGGDPAAAPGTGPGHSAAGSDPPPPRGAPLGEAEGRLEPTGRGTR